MPSLLPSTWCPLQQLRGSLATPEAKSGQLCPGDRDQTRARATAGLQLAFLAEPSNKPSPTYK